MRREVIAVVDDAPSNEPPTRTRILVVEDDRASRSAMMQLLRMTGFEPLSAASVSEGLDMLAWQPSCLILDLMLPDGNGADVLAHIRKQRLPIRVVVTTGAIEWQKMLQASPVPPDAVFQKPVDFKQLVTWLRENCDGSGHAFPQAAWAQSNTTFSQ